MAPSMAASTLRGLRLAPTLQPALLQQHQRLAGAFQRPMVAATTLQFQRAFASKHDQQGKQILIRDHGVFANYVPPDKQPSITDFGRWRLTKWRNLKNGVQNMLSVGLIKYKSQYEKWDSRKFLEIAEETYKDMNDAFARGDREVLEETCLDSMYSTLKNQIKNRGNARWEWRYHGEVEAPKIVCIRCVGTTGLSKHGFAVAQATLRMYTKQSMAVYDKKNRLIGGDPHKIHNVLEYVVFQKTISDPEDMWRVYGKIASPEKLQQQ